MVERFQAWPFWCLNAHSRDLTVLLPPGYGAGSGAHRWHRPGDPCVVLAARGRCLDCQEETPKYGAELQI